MLNDLALKFNPVDFLALAIICRCVWIGRRKGIRVEVFKLIGIFVSIFVIFHYFAKVGVFLAELAAFPVILAELLAFVVLWLVTTVVFSVCCDSWQLMYKPEEKNITHSSLPAAVLGGIRGCLVTSLALALLMLTGNGYLREQVERSLSAQLFGQISIVMYRGMFTGVSLVFPSEQRNDEIIGLYGRPAEDEAADDNAAVQTDDVTMPVTAE